MKILSHHIYEYKKGLRSLVLHTMPTSYKADVKKKLEANRIAYVIQNVSAEKINIYFGAPDCIEVIRTFGDKPLNQLSPEQDFILGTMLGYSRLQQCERYLRMKNLAEHKLHISKAG